MITEYLVELLEELRLPGRRRRRILAEVEDHLACVAAELHAGGLGVAEAESEAVRRFGPAGELARSFVEHEAALSGKRVARASGMLAVLVAILILGRPGPVLPHSAFPDGVATFVLAQVALMAGGLTLVRAWREAPAGGPRGRRLAAVHRGAVVVVGCATGTVALRTAEAVAHSGSGWTVATWLVLASLGLGVAVTAVTLFRSWRQATAAGIASAAMRRQMIDAVGARERPPDTDRIPDAVADLQAVAVLALARLQRRFPTLEGVMGRLIVLVHTLPNELARRVPRLAASLALCRHPWRFAASAATTAGLALAAGHALTEGVSVRHVPGALLAAALIATIEALAVLLGYAVLGRFLGIRPPRRPG
jgi:hypothetical protein